MHTNILDSRVRDAFSTWNRIDELDVKILESLSFLGPRNLALIAKHLEMPASSLGYRVRRMLSKSILFLHLNPYHTYMGLKKALTFVEASQGYEDVLLNCLKVNDFWLLLCRIYRPYEGCGGIWTIPEENTKDFEAFLQSLLDHGIASSVEINWSTCFEGVPVQSRWFNLEGKTWAFNWDEWIREVETIKGELPYTLVDPDDWPIKVDYADVLIIKELEKNGRASLTDISKAVGVSLNEIKYHFREHVSKRGLIEGYQIEIYRFPSLVSEYIFFKFEFDSYETMAKFALSLHDKPFPIFIGKVLNENAIITQVYLPRHEFRRFITALSCLVRRGLLKRYSYFIEDMFKVWRQTIPYNHFKNGRWIYDNDKQCEELRKILSNKG